MPDSTRRGLVALLCTLVLAGGLWLLLAPGNEPGATTARGPARVAQAVAPIPPEHMPPPFGERKIRQPDPEEPAPSQTAAFCATEKWSRMDLLVSQSDAGEFRVDPVAWSRNLTGSRAGIASWMSTCRRDGRAVRIVAADSGILLATYDRRSGLRTPSP